MKITKKILQLIFIFLVITSGCDENSTSSNNTSEQNFPNEKGNQWVYLVKDSVANITDTLTVTVNSQITFNDGKDVTVWNLKYSNREDSLFIRISADTVWIFKSSFSTERRTIIFPLFVGKQWNGDFVNDTVKVVSMGNVSVPGGNFNDVYFIIEQWSSFNYNGAVYLWLKPGIGIIKMQEINTGFSFKNETWELISHNF